MPNHLRILPSPIEIQLQKDIEDEFFTTRLPVVHLYKRTREVHDNLGVDLGDSLGDPIELHANWDGNRKRKELRNGFYVQTQRIEIKFLVSELDTKGITLEKGDIIDLSPDPAVDDDKYELLEVEREGRIRMHHHRLFRVAIIDLEHVWSP